MVAVVVLFGTWMLAVLLSRTRRRHGNLTMNRADWAPITRSSGRGRQAEFSPDGLQANVLRTA